MASILMRAYNFAFVDYVDHRSDGWFMATTPFPTLALLALYLYFVKVVGPEVMKTRPPFNLKTIMMWYNLFQVLVSTYIFVTTANIVYLYYMVKIIDLLDTIFFILRKKFAQASFLHVYHHAGMVMVGFFACKYSLNGHYVLVGVVNSFVHVFMYAYYFLSAVWPKYRKQIWWKKYITILQLVQFFFLAIHSALPLLQPACQVEKIWACLLLPQFLVMTLMFGDFYRKAYVKKKESVE